MITCRNVLLSGQTGPQENAAATSVFYTPEIRSQGAVETLYKFVVEDVVGSPSSASLTVAWQAALRTTMGNVGDTTDFTDANPVWVTIAAASYAAILPDGDWPSPLADETLAAPVLYLRRILGGFSHRLAITPSFTGGTSPGFVMSLECETRY